MLVLAPLCRAQDAPLPPSSNSPNQSSNQKPADSSTQPSGERRLFGLMPSYGMVEAGRQPPPLTSGQKFKLSAQYLNLYTVFFVAAEAGVNQARNSPKDYGQGAEGYAKRYGAGFADIRRAAFWSPGRIRDAKRLISRKSWAVFLRQLWR
jgi:hypothetical protein